MTAESPADITGLLNAWRRGDPAALDRLSGLIYEDLRMRARRYMRNQARGNTLQATALVNEAYLRLIDVKNVDWSCRAHFFAVAAKIMRWILVDRARVRVSLKRGGDFKMAAHSTAINLDEVAQFDPHRSAGLVAVNDALDALTKIDARKARVVELRFFGGLTEDEVAEVLQISPRSVKRDWKLAKAWLRAELG